MMSQERCRSLRCEEAAQALRVVYNTSGDQLRVNVKNWPSFGGAGEIDVTLR